MTIFNLRGRALVHVVTLMCSTSFLLFGYDNGVMSGLITSDQFYEVFPSLNGNSDLQGTVTSLLCIGSFFGSLLISGVGDRLGRRPCVLYGSIVVTLGVVIQTAAFSVAQMIVGRITTGFGLGMLTSTTPVYQSECSKAVHRGHDIGVELSTLIVGIVIAYWIDYGFAYLPHSISWRFPLAFQLVFIFILIVLAYFLPESPRWLLLHDRIDEGLQVISDLRGLPCDDPDVIRERNEIMSFSGDDMSSQVSWKDLFLNGGIQRGTRVGIACFGSMLQQLTGTNALTYYSTVIYEQNVGLSRHLSLLMGGFLQLWFLASSIVTWYLIDRAGRRRLFLTGLTGMTICMAVLSAMIHTPGKGAGIIATIATFLFQSFFTWGTMANTWVYPSELLPLSARTKGAALSTATSWIFTYMVVQIVPVAAANIGYRLYIIFAALNASMCIFCYFFFPETASLSLESVDMLFIDSADKGIVSGLRQAVEKSLDVRSQYKGRHTEIDLQLNPTLKIEMVHQEYSDKNDLAQQNSVV
ncbi:putative hexose carrier protein [Lipomyces oligophaga]|uniref:putative hexose carrier protein n=1 Tax=Lipomyces oligophaga TaxID=45792 RepID=UPI0034CD29DA